MKGKENTDTYRCLNCGWTMPAEEQGKEPDHCPNCLLAIHEEDREGNECGGILEPVGIWSDLKMNGRSSRDAASAER